MNRWGLFASFSVERAANPLWFSRGAVVVQNSVEPAGPVSMRAPSPEKPPFRGEDDAPSLGGGNAFRRAAKIGIRAQTHFDKNQRVTFQTDQIEFSAPAAHVASKNFETLSSQPCAGVFFGPLSVCLR